MQGKLEGQRALVTGGSRGIGRAIALAYADAGADVAIGYRRDAAAVRALVAATHETLGGLDIVVAKAGVPTRFEPLHEVDPGYWQRVIDIDLNGVFNTLQATLPILREPRGGVILTISSVAADLCGPNGGPYVAAKAAVNALTKVVARENASRRIRCNVIAPGLIATDLADGMVAFHGEAIVKSIPLRRMGSPEEVAQLATYLASDDAAWLTGKIFRIDCCQQI